MRQTCFATEDGSAATNALDVSYDGTVSGFCTRYQQMQVLWRIIGAALAFVGIYFVRRRFGTGASLIAVGVLLVGWWFLYRYTERRLDGLYREFQQLDDDQKAKVLKELDPEIRKDLEKRIERDTNK